MELLLALLALSADADLLLYNGRVVTVDARFSIAEAVAIKGNRIVATGATKALLAAERGPRTTVIDLAGKMVLPGLIDSHVHPLEAGLSEERAPLPRIRSFEDVRQYLRQQERALPKGQWIEIPRTFPTRLAEQAMPTKALLDLVQDHPVHFDIGAYVRVLNSRALRECGITRDTPNPPRGEIVKGADGEPNGVLRNAAILLKGHLKPALPFTDAQKLAALEKMLARYARAGLTSVGEGGAEDDEVALYQQLHREKRLPVRVAMTWWHDINRPLEELLAEVRAAKFTTNTGDDWLRFAAYKVNMDGGMTIGTAFQRAPYGGYGKQLYGMTNPDDRGQLFSAPDKLYTLLREARSRGWQLAAHAQGGGAIDGFLAALERINKEFPIAPTRAHVIHGSFQNPESIALAKRLGMLEDVQAAWLYFDAPALTKVFQLPGMRYFFPLRSYLNAGLLVAGGSDHMIGHDKNSAINPYNPFLGLWTSVTRKMTTGQALCPEERVSREEALRMYTIWGAHRQFGEKVKGSIEAGKLADLIVLDRDYLTCPEDDIAKIEPVLTVLDGRVVYRSPSAPRVK
ncbi:MAG: amidohydrolase [Bryobacteraceae bacterium]|nr:amidohydrolase [Bryobacteraceae bacterium]